MITKARLFTKSLFALHVPCSPCNNCDIEIAALFTPRFDVERLGIQLVGSVRHADILLCTGCINKKIVHRLRRIYAQAPKPVYVIAVGGCACSQIIFNGSYNVCGPLDKIIPVDVYVPGCPPRPEAMIAGVQKLIAKIHAGAEPINRKTP